MYFNPRSREGSDYLESDTYHNEMVFQSTLPRRERLRYNRDKKERMIISIHAPAKGATEMFLQCYDFDGISIHAPAKGATGIEVRTMNFTVFQSTLPRRERLKEPFEYGCIVQFQSTLPRRERLITSIQVLNL